LLDRAAFEDMSFLTQATGNTPCHEYNGFYIKHARESGQPPGHKPTSQRAYFHSA